MTVDAQTIRRVCMTCGEEKIITISPNVLIGKLVKCLDCINGGKEPPMKAARVEFCYPQTKRVQRQVEVGWLRKRKEVVVEEVPMTFFEVYQMVQNFVNSIGQDRLIGISEYTTAKDRIGDDGNHWFVVWYWEQPPA